MTQQPNHKPGDVVNGHRLGEDNVWHPIEQDAPATKGGLLGWMGRHKVLTGIGAFLVLMIVFASLSGGGDDDTTTTAVAATASATPTPTEETTAEATAEPVVDETTEEPEPEPAEPEMTRAQENALRSAQSYLDFKGFSKQGLIDQLSSEYGDGYELKDAKWAVNQLDVNWKEQAVRSAESYLDFKGFSCNGLIDQLSSEYGEQFTKKQATYAAKEVGLC